LPPDHLNPPASAVFDLDRLRIVCPHGSSSGRPADSSTASGTTSMMRSSDIVASSPRRCRSILKQLSRFRFIGLIYVGHPSQHCRSVRRAKFLPALFFPEARSSHRRTAAGRCATGGVAAVMCFRKGGGTLHIQLRGHTGLYCSGVIIIRRTTLRTILIPLITIITITIAIRIV
jgi:hypothetical protein